MGLDGCESLEQCCLVELSTLIGLWLVARVLSSGDLENECKWGKDEGSWAEP